MKADDDVREEAAGAAGVEVEAAPEDITIHVQGPRRSIVFIDKEPGEADGILLFTRDYGAEVAVFSTQAAVQVGADSKVVQVVNRQEPCGSSRSGPGILEIPPGGYVLCARGGSVADNGDGYFLAEKFRVGDLVKLRRNGQVVPVQELMGSTAKLELDNYPMATVTGVSQWITGTVGAGNAGELSAVRLFMNGVAVPVSEGGRFSYCYPLQRGVNYVRVQLLKKDGEETSRELVIFSRGQVEPKQEVVLWVDQTVNARRFQSGADVLDFLQRAKDNGVSKIALDVKGVEGFVSYKKNDLTGRPYVSEIKAPAKAGANPELDLLKEFIAHGHTLGLEIHAAVNVFAEGSIVREEYAVLDDHPDWEERIYIPENNGEIKRQRESAKKGPVAFVNPSHDQVWEYERLTFEEIIKNYQVDGIIHDRSRYDNETADFSDVTRAKFEVFLRARGKRLVNWPADVFFYDGTTRVDGPLIHDWWEFRAGTIKRFFAEIRELASSYSASSGRRIQVSAYVGSWYEIYYLNGVNWGSPNFRFDARLGLQDGSVYTPEYCKTGYIGYLDFLMTGAYQTTRQEVEKYVTLANIVTNGEIPLYTGIAVSNVPAPALQRGVIQAGLAATDGVMLFDASQINWPVARAALRDEECEGE
ncbi:family 10 glycosylhydrolase [Paenibacillus sp. YN15]|uniref:family 10 glycosylhydrolase n=1 Tax=Paenibacillus sp. YN15 TaxID=1742774 RepID=UPI000DCF0198|nr:family 10 glycosylhydrolase [Paenibacillus sp. YN15]RAU96160.1 hypothetical protein DQG13_21080 [Paenibacillus sp. YN15]